MSIVNKKGDEYMKIGFLSDIHLDVNKNFPVIKALSDFCNDENLDKVVFAGDFSSDFTTISYVIDYLNRHTKTQLHFIPGNHDLYICHDKNSRQIYNELCQLHECLVNHPVELGEWVIIGDTGWYDYSYRDDAYTIRQIQKKSYHGMMWADKRYFQWGTDDIEINDYFLSNLENLLIQYRDKKIIAVTHTVPFQDFVKYKNNDPTWNYFLVFIGSKKIGQLYEKYSAKIAVFGHTHFRFNQSRNDMLCLCRPLGYHFEWKNSFNIQKEIQDAFYVIEI